MRFLLFSLLGMTASLMLVAAPAAGDSGAARARAALQAGEILPLTRILQEVHRDFSGDVIAVELEREDGRWIYEIKLLAPRGSVLELEYDARTARLLKAKGSGVDAARRTR